MNATDQDKRNISPVEEEEGKVWRILLWILIALLVVVVTTQLSSRLGTRWLLPDSMRADVFSRYEADYSPWPSQSLNLDLQGLATAALSDSEDSFGSAATLTPTPTATYTPTPTPTITPSPTVTNTPLPTATPTVIFIPVSTATTPPVAGEPSSTPSGSEPTNPPPGGDPTDPPPTDEPDPTPTVNTGQATFTPSP